jgi:hypothetical protein
LDPQVLLDQLDHKDQQVLQEPQVQLAHKAAQGRKAQLDHKEPQVPQGRKAQLDHKVLLDL